MIQRPRIAAIVDRAVMVFGLERNEILGEARSRVVCRARFAAALAAKRHGYSSPLIGRHLGGRDHSTILAAQKRAEEWAANDPTYAEQIERIAS